MKLHFLLPVVFIFSMTFAGILYVDPQIPSASCNTYSAANRSCSGGSLSAYRDLQAASSAAMPGDTVFLRGATYSSQFQPQKSGNANSYIIFKPYADETVILSGISNPAIYLLNRSYIIIDRFTVSNVLGWGRIESSNHCIIRNCTFTQATATGTTGGLKFVSSSFNKVLDNNFTDGNDNILLQESHNNLFTGNIITKARHTLFNISCSDSNVVRLNTFNNPDQKAVEVFDCEGAISGQQVFLDATKRNLFDRNVFSGTAASTRTYDYNAMQYAGQHGIVRRSIYYNCLGGGIHFQVYPDEALYNYGNRVYSNTIYNNRCFGLGASNDANPAQYHDNKAINNLLYKNSDCSGGGGQISIGNQTAVILTSNTSATSDPLFVDENGHDFHLRSASQMIDSGLFLTRTSSAGSGTSVSVLDASYFSDGFSIEGESGDTIQLEGQTNRAIVIDINYASNTLILDQSLTWTAGIGVALAYDGSSPDQGAFEYHAQSQTGKFIMPVPGRNGLLSIEISGRMAFINTSSAGNLRIMNMRGEMIRQALCPVASRQSSSIYYWDISSLSPGIYLAEIINKNGKGCKRFTVHGMHK